MQLLHITARNPRTNNKVNLFFRSITEAKEHNPDLAEFEIVSTAKQFKDNLKKVKLPVKKKQSKLSDILGVRAF